MIVISDLNKKHYRKDINKFTTKNTKFTFFVTFVVLFLNV